MKVYPYTATHDGGTSMGSVEASTPEAAEKKIIKALTSTETKKTKIENLSVKIGDPIENEEE